VSEHGLELGHCGRLIDDGNALVFHLLGVEKLQCVLAGAAVFVFINLRAHGAKVIQGSFYGTLLAHLPGMKTISLISRALLVLISILSYYATPAMAQNASVEEFIHKHCPGKYGFTVVPGATDFDPTKQENIMETCRYVETLDRLLDQYAGHLRYCYEKALLTEPDLKLTMPIMLGLSGGAITVVSAGGQDQPDLRTCVLSSIQQIRAPTDIKPVMFTGRLQFGLGR
jgi:hypothetical protein